MFDETGDSFDFDPSPSSAFSDSDFDFDFAPSPPPRRKPPRHIPWNWVIGITGGVLLLAVAAIGIFLVTRAAANRPTAGLTPTPPVAAATPAPTLTAAPYQVLYAIPHTTVYTFTQDNLAQAHDLLTTLGVPADEQQIGVGGASISPTATWPLLAEINDIAGAVYQAETGRLLLLGAHNPNLPELAPDDLLVALRSAYSDQDDVGVSIDPINPNERGGPMQVNYFGGTENTHLGLVMYEADRYLKILSMGQDNITKRPVTSSVPGYRSELDWALEFYSQEQDQRWHRMWYLVKDGTLDIKTSADGTAMMFDAVPLIVQARFVEFDAQGQKHDVPGSSPSVDAFVNHFNSHFAEFAAEKSEVGQLVQLTKLLSIARWLRQNNAEIDLAWLGNAPVDNVKTPARTPGQTVSKSRSEQQGNSVMTYQVSLFGGVDFQFTNKARVPPARDPVHYLGEAAANVPLDQTRSAASVNIGGQEYQVAPVFLRQPELPGNLTFAREILAAPTGGRLPLKLTLHYDSFNREPLPVAPGWSLESWQLTFPPQRMRYEIGGRPVELYNSVTLIGPTPGQRRQYRNAQKTRNGLVVYELTSGQGPAQLYYDYSQGVYSLHDGEIEHQFTGDGQLAARSLGNERIVIRRDASGKPIAYEHSGGAAVHLRYERGRLIEVIGSDKTRTSLTYDGNRLVKIARPDGATEIAYTQGQPYEIRDGADIIFTDLDALGRVVRRQTGELVRTFSYAPDGSSVETIEGIPGRFVTIERNLHGRITRVIVTEETRTADAQAARAAEEPEQGSLFQTLLQNPALDLAWLTGGQFKQVVIEPVGNKRTVRLEGDALVVDGRLSLEQLQKNWQASRQRLDQLDRQGCIHITLDPESGIAGGYNSHTGEMIILIPDKDGQTVQRVFPGLRNQQDLARLVTDLAGQAMGLKVAGMFQTSAGKWGWLTPAGEFKSFLSDKEAELKRLDNAARIPGNREQARRLAEQLGAAMRQDIIEIFTADWQAGSTANASQLAAEAYLPVAQLFRGKLPADVIRQLPQTVQAGEMVQLKPLETPFGWLLPGQGPVFLDVSPSQAFLVSYYLGANDIRLIDAHSTPLRARACLDQEQPRTGQDIVIIFTPHSQSTPEEAQAQRDAFQPTRQRLEKLGVRVIDIGENPQGSQILLQELGNENMAVFEIGHSAADGSMYIYGGGRVRPADFQAARGEKYFMTCCSIQNGLSAAAVRAGANSATGAVEPVTLDEVNAWLDRMADYLEQHPQGILPSIMEHDLRLQMLIEHGGPGRAPGFIPTSRDPDRGLHIG